MLIKLLRCSIIGVVLVKKIIGKILNFNYVEIIKKIGKKIIIRDYVIMNLKRKRIEKKSIYFCYLKIKLFIDKEINCD